MSETSRHDCVSNSATSRNKDALHILSHQRYVNIVVQEKIRNTFIYLGSLATLHTFYKNIIRKQALFIF